MIKSENICNGVGKSTFYFITKRLIDVTFSLFSLIIFMPLLFVIAVLIKLDSQGPVIFKQERIGLNEKHFKMYKFRTMCADAEDRLDAIKHNNEMSGPMFKMRNDPRITNIGRFLRKTSLDELPQLFNILKGEMSLVGPRPNLPREVEKFTKEQKKKFMAKPGLTCYWQVMGRSNIDFEDWMLLDMKYIEERNTWVDIKLIIKTMAVLFGDDGAR